MQTECPLLTIGADPEWAPARRGSSMSAADLFAYYDHGRGGDFIGTDGSASTGEIRPAPATTAEGLVTNIHACLALLWLHIEAKCKNDKYTDIDDFVIRAGTYQYRKALGGHIHFGGRWFGKREQAWSTTVSQFLDKTLGVILQAAAGAYKVQKRYDIGYGRYSGMRWQDHGVEWRTPPSWPISPNIALAVAELALELFKTSLPENRRFYGKIRHIAHSDPNLRQLISWMRGDFHKLEEFAKKQAEEVFNLLGGKLLYSEGFLTKIVEGEQWDEDRNLFGTWNFPANLCPEALNLKKATVENRQKLRNALRKHLETELDNNGYLECGSCKLTKVKWFAAGSTGTSACPQCGVAICLGCKTSNFRTGIVTCPKCKTKYTHYIGLDSLIRTY